jgi:nucleotide-binding universal stress UspA family protein/nitrite reductase/ring-hydroxylating ferredoxin subunit
MGYRKILAGTDGSKTAEVAVSVAARLAARTGADLHLVMGWQPPRIDAAGADAILAKAQEEAAVVGDKVKITGEHHIGDGAAVILDVAKRRGSDLVVMGNKGMGKARRIGLGAVPDKVAHMAECDVLIVRTTHQNEPVGRAEGLYSNIVVGTDGSPTASEAASRAFELAAMVRSEITLVFVGDAIVGAIAVEETAKNRIGRTKVNPAVVPKGDPASVLNRTARETGAQLVVVGNKGMTGARRVLLASVPNKVSHTAPADVLVVRTVGRTIEDLRPGSGGVVLAAGRKVAAFLDERGVLHASSPRCTHMGCTVDWNETERTWDCPCHGSRYDVDGHVIHGPAQKDLEPA